MERILVIEQRDNILEIIISWLFLYKYHPLLISHYNHPPTPSEQFSGIHLNILLYLTLINSHNVLIIFLVRFNTDKIKI